MNKKIVLSVVGVVVVVVAAAACLLMNKAKKDDYCNVIPQQSILIARVAPTEFLEKNNLELEDFAERAGVPSRFVKLGMSYIKGCGIDITTPLYIFVDAKGNVGAVMGLTSEKDFASLLETEGQMTVQKGANIKYVTPGNQEAIIAFDSKKVMFYASTRNGKVSAEAVEKMMSQPADKSILDEKIYEQLIDCKKSFAVNVDYKACVDLFKEVAPLAPTDVAVLSSSSAMIPDMNCLLTWDVEDDKMQFTTDCFPNGEKAEKAYDELMSYCTPISGDFAGKGMDNPLAWMCFSIPGEKIMDFINKIPGVDVALAAVSKEVDVAGTISSFNGDALFALSVDFKANEPQILVMTKMDGKGKYIKTLDKAVEISAAQNPDFSIAKNGSLYNVTKKFRQFCWDEPLDELDCIDEEGNVSIMPHYKDTIKQFCLIQADKDLLVIGTDKDVIASASKESKAMSAYASDMKGCTLYGVVDFQAIAKAIPQDNDNQKFVKKQLVKFQDAVLKSKARHGELTIKTMGGKNFIETSLEIANEVRANLNK